MNITEYAEQTRNPYVSGAYAPIHTEVEATDLNVIGEVPKDIDGFYFRNGPNPRFTPVGHYHWFDGDGMIHAVHIKDGKVSYRNRYVRTDAFHAETKAGDTLWQGVMGDMSKNPMSGHLPLKDSANTAVAYHNNHILAGWYMCGELYAVDPISLETKGKETCNGSLSSRVMAHVKIDEHTNEMMFFDYGPRPPYLSYGIINGDGVVSHFEHIDIPGPRLPHDMAITENYSILMDLPLIHDPEALKHGKSKIVFKRDMASRFGVIPRYGDNNSIRWFEANPCYLYHVINAWEEGDEIIMDCCITVNPTPQENFTDPIDKLNAYLRLEARLYRYRFNMKTGETKELFMDDRFTEFPLMNSSYAGRKSRFSYNQKFDLSEKLRFDGLIKYDMETGKSQVHEYGKNKFGSEAPFVPAQDGQDEDDGYVVSFVTDEVEGTSELVILDAKNVDKDPLARVEMPQRVPLGFHACWVEGSRIQS